MKKTFILFLTLLLILTMSGFYSSVYASDESDYDPSCVLVTIKKEYSAQGRTYYPEEFSKELVESIKPLMYITDEMLANGHSFNLENFKDIIQLNLKEPSPENVDKLIKELEGNPLVDSADKNYILYTEVYYIAGDTDLNGKLTASDARTILRISVELENNTAQQDFQFDANADGKITASDARYVLRASVLLEPLHQYVLQQASNT